METICEKVDKALVSANITEIQCLLREIKIQAGKMEDRLLKYCNAIEDLGFTRNGRDYKNL